MARATPGSRLFPTLAVAALVALAAGDVGAAEPSADPRIEEPVGWGSAAHARLARVITEEGSNSSVPWKEWGAKRPTLGDFDQDGNLEIVEQNENFRVYVIDPKRGRVLAELANSKPHWARPTNGPKVGDVDGDGILDLVAASPAGTVDVWSFDPWNSTKDHYEFKHRWRARPQEHTFRLARAADAAPTLADLNNDGKLEILLMTEGRAIFAFTHDGKVLWNLAEYGGNAEADAADVNGDGYLDGIFFTDGGRIHAYSGKTGKLLWTFSGRAHGASPGSIPSRGLVTDLDKDGKPDFVVCERNVRGSNLEEWKANSHFYIFAVDHKGNLRWKDSPEWGSPMCSAYLVGHDVDGDGRPELFGMDWNTLGHYPGNWEKTGPSHVFSYTPTGKLRWSTTLRSSMSKNPFAMADVNGDGRQDLLVQGYKGAVEHLLVLDADTGEVTGGIRTAPWMANQGPLVADLWGKGSMQVALAVTDTPNSGAPEAWLIYDLGKPFDSAWPGWEGPRYGDPEDAPDLRSFRLKEGSSAEPEPPSPSPAAGNETRYMPAVPPPRPKPRTATPEPEGIPGFPLALALLVCGAAAVAAGRRP